MPMVRWMIDTGPSWFEYARETPRSILNPLFHWRLHLGPSKDNSSSLNASRFSQVWYCCSHWNTMIIYTENINCPQSQMSAADGDIMYLLRMRMLTWGHTRSSRTSLSCLRHSGTHSSLPSPCRAGLWTRTLVNRIFFILSPPRYLYNEQTIYFVWSTYKLKVAEWGPLDIMSDRGQQIPNKIRWGA